MVSTGSSLGQVRSGLISNLGYVLFGTRSPLLHVYRSCFFYDEEFTLTI